MRENKERESDVRENGIKRKWNEERECVVREDGGERKWDKRERESEIRENWGEIKWYDKVWKRESEMREKMRKEKDWGLKVSQRKTLGTKIDFFSMK